MKLNGKIIRKGLRFFFLTLGILVGFFFLLKALPFGILHYPFFGLYTRIYTEYIEPLIDTSERILIIAPHCDDEVLAGGGVIQRAVTEGKTVKVVFVTSGDGFGSEYEGLRVANQLPRGVSLGYLRQREAIEALETLGLAKENVIFLGYPDRGLEEMWWLFRSNDQPFYSRYIKSDRSPYLTSFTPGAVFSGDQLLEDLIRIFDSFQPGTLYLPDPYDLHPDHWASYCFAREALVRLGALGSEWVDQVQILLYLVHYGRFNWPPRWGYHPRSRHFPPRNLLTVRRWTSIELTPEETALKKEALESYRSQKVLREFLLAFAKRNEIFAHDQTYQLPWNETLTMLDYRRESTIPTLVRGGDIQKVELEQGDDRFSITLFVNSGIPLQVRYRVFMVGYREGKDVFRESYVIFDRRRAVKTRGDYLSDPPLITSGPAYLRLDLPLNHRQAPEKLFFAAESFLQGDLMVDRFPWSMVVFEEGKSYNHGQDEDKLFPVNDAVDRSLGTRRE